MATGDATRPGPPPLRQQRWALHAYAMAERVMADGTAADSRWKDYARVVNDLGPNVLRLGLAGAMAAVERERERGGSLLLEHLAAARVRGLEGAGGRELPDRARRLDIGPYMVATREILQVAAWLRRAVQAHAANAGTHA